MSRDADGTRHWAWTLAAIVAGGAALRLAGVGAESVDLEEYACVGALHIHGLRHFLIEQRALYPFGAPLVPLLYYFWSGLFGDGIVAVRLLSALAGTALLVPLALLAREIWPDNPRTARTAGLIAALCAALSPVHLFQAQEARMYAFVALFAALSGLSLLRAARTGQRRWWAVNLAVNAALVWSHYFAVFLWPAQALWLLFAPGVRWRALLSWLSAQALMLVPVAVWMSGIAVQPQELHDYYTMPDLSLVARNLVAGDAVYWSSSAYFPSGRAWSFAPEAVRRAVVSAHPLGDVLIAGVFASALLWGALRLLRGRRLPVAHTGYLVLWAVVPLLLLVALSLAWKPIYASRYLTHASLALYLLLGGIMAWLPGRVRAAGVVALVAVYGWQLSLALPPQTRTAWKEAAGTIEAADGSKVITLVQGVFWKPVFETNVAPNKLLLAAVLEPETMAEMGDFVLRALSSLEPGTRPVCWVVLVDAIHGQGGRFESAAAPRGARLQKYDFPGERVLNVYRMTPDTNAVAATAVPAPPALTELAQVIADHAADPAVEAFLDAMRARPDPEGGGYLRLGIGLAQQGRVALAAAVLDEALAHWPAHLVDLALLQRDLCGRGNFAPLVDRALERVKIAPERTFSLRQILQSLVERKEIDALCDACHRMIAAFPDYPEGYGYLGKQDYDEQKFAEALPNLERAVALDPAQPGHVYAALNDSLMEAGRCADALRLVEQGLAHDPGNGTLVIKLAEAHLECGDPARAEALTVAVLAANPGQDQVRRLLVDALLRRGAADQAGAELNKLLDKSPDDTILLLMLWRVRSQQRRDAEAEKALRRMAETTPAVSGLALPLVDALYARRDRAAAETALLRITGGKPPPPDTMAILDRLTAPGQPPAAAGGSSS